MSLNNDESAEGKNCCLPILVYLSEEDLKRFCDILSPGKDDVILSLTFHKKGGPLEDENERNAFAWLFGLEGGTTHEAYSGDRLFSGQGKGQVI